MIVARSENPRFRIGVWDLLEAAPLAAGLACESEIELVAADSQALVEQFSAGQLHAAMFGPGEIAAVGGPVVVLSAGCLACAGKSLEAVLVSRGAPSEVESVVSFSPHPSAELLLQVLWRMEYETPVRISHATPGDTLINADAVLLTSSQPPLDPPREFGWTSNLSRAWFEMTGLPMPWCLWVADPHADLEHLTAILERGRERGADLADGVAATEARRRGWPEDVARQHVATFGDFAYHEDHGDALRELLGRAAEVGLIVEPPSLRFYTVG